MTAAGELELDAPVPVAWLVIEVYGMDPTEPVVSLKCMVEAPNG